MSKKKNYKAMYNNQPEATFPEVSSIVMPADLSEVIETPVEGVIETVEEPKCEFVTGVVTGCSRLNVRNYPATTAEVICTIPVWSELQICTSHDVHDMWYHVYTAAGQEGYCMKQFIEIK